jgi:hypothetical protein
MMLISSFILNPVNNKKIFVFCTSLLLALFPAFGHQLNSNEISLNPVKEPFIPAEFYIHNVSDFRANKAPIISLIVFAPDNNNFSIIKTDLKGGTFSSIKAFLSASLPANKKLRPVNVSLTKIKISEDKTGNGLVTGNVELVLEFFLEKPYGAETHLLTFTGKGKYQRSSNAKTVVEYALQRVFINGLTYFNSYINREAPNNVKLAKSVKLAFADYTGTDEDTVYYSRSRPLIWDDFKGKLSSSKYAAYVYPEFGYEENVSIVNGVIYAKFRIRVSLTKSASWVNVNARNSYVLNHEQRHFDIGKILAEKFKEDISSGTLTPDNYEGIINIQYLETLREIHKMQKSYDDETNHGLNASEQSRWNKLIDGQLAKYGVK